MIGTAVRINDRDAFHPNEVGVVESRDDHYVVVLLDDRTRRHGRRTTVHEGGVKPLDPAEAAARVVTERVNDEWLRLVDEMAVDTVMTAAEAYARCPWWRRGVQQLAHALRSLADAGVIDKPVRGKFVRPAGVTVADGRIKRQLATVATVPVAGPAAADES